KLGLNEYIIGKPVKNENGEEITDEFILCGNTPDAAKRKSVYYSKYFIKIIEYLEYHDKYDPSEEIEKPLKKDFEDVVCDFDYKWSDLDFDTIFHIMSLADYLN